MAINSQLRHAIAAVAIAASAVAAQAQTISQPLATQTWNVLQPLATIGQVFTATQTTTVSAINVRSRTSTSAGVLYIYTGDQGSGTTGVLGTPAYSQTGITLTDAGTNDPVGGYSTILLSTPFPVVAGNKYTFMVGAPGEVRLAASLSNPYPGGAMIYDYGMDFWVVVDLAFQVFEGAPPVTSVPTLSGWGLASLAGLAGLLGAAASRRKNPRSRG